MGGAVSSGSDNNELVDNLMSGKYIRSKKVEQVFRALDRADYMTPESYDHAYKDLAWRSGPLHLSSPCIYSEVMEGLELGEGLSFLNIGSGTGYLSSLVGLILGSQGINHGVEVHPEVYEYALTKLALLLENSPVVDDFDFCQPKFYNGNGLCLDSLKSGYDRVYCGAACPTEYESYFRNLIKVGGILVMPLNDTLVQVRRVSKNKWVSRSLLSVTFAPLRVPTRDETAKLLKLDEQRPPRLELLSRGAVRAALRDSVTRRHPELRERARRPPPRVRPACPRRICIPVEPPAAVEGLNVLHDLDAENGADEMNALLSLVISMGHNRVAGALRFDRLETGSDSSADSDADRDDDETPPRTRSPAGDRTGPGRRAGHAGHAGHTGHTGRAGHRSHSETDDDEHADNYDSDGESSRRETKSFRRSTRSRDLKSQKRDSGGQSSKAQKRDSRNRDSKTQRRDTSNRDSKTKRRDLNRSSKSQKHDSGHKSSEFQKGETENLSPERSSSRTLRSVFRCAVREAREAREAREELDTVETPETREGQETPETREEHVTPEAREKDETPETSEAHETPETHESHEAPESLSTCETEASAPSTSGSTDSVRSDTTQKLSKRKSKDCKNSKQEKESSTGSSNENSPKTSEIDSGKSLKNAMSSEMDCEENKTDTMEASDEDTESCPKSKAKRQKLDSGIGESTPGSSSPAKSKSEESNSDDYTDIEDDDDDEEETKCPKASARRAARGAGGGAGGGADARSVRVSQLMRDAALQLPLPPALKRFVNLDRDNQE